MFKNYLRTGINHLLGDKQSSDINIAGLAFGLAASAIALSIAWLPVVSDTVKVATTNPVYALRYA